MGDDAIRLKSEVEKLRSQNEKLQQQLATAQAQLQQKGRTGSQAASAAETALGFNDEGLRLYKEKKYVAYINLGDAYVKLERRSEAKQAYDKYLELAPNSREAADVAAKLKALAP